MINSWSKCLTPVALGAMSLKTTSIGRFFKISFILCHVLGDVKSELPNNVTPFIGYICWRSIPISKPVGNLLSNKKKHIIYLIKHFKTIIENKII